MPSSTILSIIIAPFIYLNLSSLIILPLIHTHTAYHSLSSIFSPSKHIISSHPMLRHLHYTLVLINLFCMIRLKLIFIMKLINLHIIILDILVFNPNKNIILSLVFIHFINVPNSKNYQSKYLFFFMIMDFDYFYLLHIKRNKIYPLN